MSKNPFYIKDKKLFYDLLKLQLDLKEEISLNEVNLSNDEDAIQFVHMYYVLGMLSGQSN